MTMREKLARSIAAVQMRPWEASGRIYKEECLAMADAALAALGEPTEAMVRAGTDAYDDGEGEWGIWRAMLGAAKGEG